MRKIYTLLFVFQLSFGFAQVAVDNVTTTTATASPITWSHMTNGSNRLLIVSVAAEDYSDNVTSITYNGVALTLIGAHSRTFAGNVELWYLLNPPSGTYDVIVNYSSSCDFVCGAVSLVNVNQTTPLGTVAVADGSTASSTVNVSTASTNELVVDVTLSENQTITAGASQTQLWKLAPPTPNFNAGATSTEPGVAGTVTMSWALAASGRWTIVATPVKMSATVCGGITAGTASLTSSSIVYSASGQLNLTGQAGGTTIQWQESTDNINFQNIPGATTTPYTTMPKTGGTYYYRAEVTRIADGCMSYSNTVTLTVSNGACGPCTRYVSGATNTTVLAGEIVCVKFGTTYTGTAQIDGGIFCVDSTTAFFSEGIFSGRFQGGSCLTFQQLDKIGCGTVNNRGTISMPTRTITMLGGTFNNTKTVTFDRLILNEEASFSTFTNHNSATLTLSNATTGLQMLGTPSSFFTNNSGGTVTITTGNVSMSTGTFTNAGTFSDALNFSKTDGTISNSGMLTVSLGDFSVDGTGTHVINSGTITITNGNYSIGSGTNSNTASGIINVNGAGKDFIITSGAGNTFSNAGDVNVNDRVDMGIGGTTLTNSGTIDANNWTMSTNSTLNNNASGAITLVTSFNETQSTNVDNDGIITTGTFFDISQAPLDNSGTINVGTNFDLTQGPLTNTGNIHTNGYADFSQGGPHFNSGCIAVAGNFTHSQSTFNGPLVGTGRFCVGGISQGSSGTFQGSGSLDMCDNGNPPGGWDIKSIYTDNGTHCGVLYTGCSNCNSILPVQWLSFIAKNKGQNVLLKWATASEINNDYFSIEKSLDANNFEPIGKVSGAGNSTSILNYEFIDVLEFRIPNPELLYYRLKQIDFDGRYKYSSIVSAELTAEDYFFAHYNSTANDAILSFYAKMDESQVLINIFDVLGKKVFTYSQNYSKGFHQINIPLNSFSTGMCFANLIIDNKLFSKKILLHK